MLVKDCYNKITKRAALIGEEEPVANVVKKMVEDPLTRSVYVTDKEGNLVGIISVITVLDFLGNEYESSVHSLIRTTLAKTAGDLMNRPISVSLDTPAEKALELSVTHRLEEIPVCEDGKVIGDIICFEIIKALEGDKE